jgi:hypothetical protein
MPKVFNLLVADGHSFQIINALKVELYAQHVCTGAAVYFHCTYRHMLFTVD